ncbi:MAG: hypothetical protein HOL37_02990 [Rhodospirillaceae bacterium]|nr:hypothetical protein [Rhodospirillaceae bacterium]MBT4218897.1 hypothetical protein [Rhodospirillaceae bacterium]MBT5013376.1 hypothetical protein [Rhodospirillaceae bacterium]MBT5308279.1 hypothetical protein [Rhodospirillaceae bacterium]MBT7354900.1 hypothetical protein [Rhodospirillaceae bacterium]
MLNVKKALGGLGFYKTPNFGRTPYPDNDLFDGLKSFQKSAGLKADGMMKPSGETEKGLNKSLSESGIGNKLFKPKPGRPPLNRPKADTDAQKYRTTPFAPIPDEASASNRRTVDSMMKSTSDGDLPNLFAGTLGDGKTKPVGEFRDFMGQLRERDPARANRFEKAVMAKLPEQSRARLVQMTGAKPTPLANVEKTSAATGSSDGFISPINKSFRDGLSEHESKVDGYKSFNPEGNGIGALGRYQMREGALKDAGLVDKETGEWTGKHGVKNARDFLNNPQAQEKAFATYMGKVEGYLHNNGSTNFLGKTFPGVKKEGIKITKSGLLAAAHRQGHGNVKKYLDFQTKNGWSSDFSAAKNNFERTIFENIETRLRLFQSKNY